MPRPSLEWLKGAARELLRALKVADPSASHRLTNALPGRAASPPTLALAQLVIARENGFVSWPKLKQGVATALALRAKPSGRQIEIERLTGQLVALARDRDLAALLRLLAVGKAVQVAVVAQLSRRPAQWAVVIDALLSGLESRHPRLRYECAHALDRFADPRSRAPLIRLMDDPVPRVRRMAMHALSCDQCKTDLFGDDEEVRLRLSARALSDASVQVRRHGAVALGYAGGPICIAALRRLTADEDAVVRRNALGALQRLEATPRIATGRR